MPQKQQDPKAVRPPQEQVEPGSEARMTPRPRIIRGNYRGSGKLKDSVALITGGDSGIGRGVAVHFAREGADIAIVHLAEEEEDANETRRLVEHEGRRCLTMVGDIGDEKTARRVVAQAVQEPGKLDILVNNAAEQHPQKSIEKVSAEQLERTFRTNVFGMFFMTKAAMPHLKQGSAIINTTSVTAYRGSPNLLDYAATKGAIVAFTLIRACGRRARHTRQCRRTGPDLDAADSFDFPQKKSQRSVAIRPWAAPANPKTSRRATCFWRRRTRRISPDRCCIRTAGRS